MARRFSSGEAKQLKNAYQAVIRGLNDAAAMEQEYRGRVAKAAENLLSGEVRALLQSISVEELNRDKKGIRIKLLRDSGYETVADLMGVPVRRLEAINGIGEESARTIHRVVTLFVNEARRNLKIRLSADRRDSASTTLVKEISAYRTVKELSASAEKLLSENFASIQYALADLKPGSGAIKWLFASAQKKQRAEEAAAQMAMRALGQ